MTLEIHIPSHPLDQFIESFVYYKDYNPTHSIDRFLPDGNVNMVFDLTDEPKFIYDNDTLRAIQTCRKVWFSGIRNHYITIPSGKDSEMFVVNFHKGMAHPFVNMPMNELTDYVVDGELAMSKPVLSLRERLIELIPVNLKFLAAEHYFLKAFARKPEVNPFIHYSVNFIVRSPQQLSIQQLAAKVGFSQKHLIKMFKDQVGVTPKEFLKITRFQKAVQDIEAARAANWTSIAFESGYYDQAHFINDFKIFSGFTPSQFIKMKRAFTNYIPVD